MRYVIPAVSAIITVALVFQFGCKEKSVDPPTVNAREYAWKIDTLRYPQTLQTTLQSIWGTSPKHIFVVGHTEVGNVGQMWHFNGTSWKSIDYVSRSSITSLTAVYGFSTNSVIAVGSTLHSNPSPPPYYLDSSAVFLFDGTSWQHYPLPGELLLAVWGSFPTDIWIAGMKGVVFHYNDLGWKTVRVRDDISFYQITGTHSSDVYLLGEKLDSQPYDSIGKYIFQFNGSDWKILDSLVLNISSPNHAFGTADLWKYDESNFYSVGYGIFRKLGGRWQKEFDSDEIITAIHGSSPRNIFAVGHSIHHFNGNYWFTFPPILNESIIFYDVLTFENQVFIVGHDGSSSFVAHGQ